MTTVRAPRAWISRMLLSIFECSTARPFGDGMTMMTGTPSLDQRDRTVLELTGGESLRVHVGELLEARRAFGCDGVTDVSTEEQDGRRRRLLARERTHRLDRLEHRCLNSRHRFEFGELARHLVRVLGAARLKREPSRQVVRGHLGEKRLGRRDADLRTCTRVQNCVSLSGNL